MEVDNVSNKLPDRRGNRKYKDSIFRTIFKEVEPFKRLFKSLTSESLNGEIKYYDTKNVVISENRRNDISFITSNGELIILVEHQSTPNINMPLRQLMYYNDLIKMHLKDTNQLKDIYSNVPVSIPSPRFIVVYNGREKIDYDYYTIDVNFKDKSNNFKVVSEVYNINYNALSLEQRNTKDELTGYSYFVDRAEYYKSIEKYEEIDPMELTIEDCKRKGLLLQYIKRKEFISMATLYLSEKDIQDIRYKDGIIAGKKEGIKEGMKENQQKVICSMLERGFDNKEISEIVGCSIEDIQIIASKNSLNKVSD